MVGVILVLIAILLVGIAMIWAVRWSRKGIDHATEPEKIGPYDLFRVGSSSYWKVFNKKLGSYFEWGKPMIMSEWDSFFSKVLIGLIVLFVIIAASVAGT